MLLIQNHNQQVIPHHCLAPKIYLKTLIYCIKSTMKKVMTFMTKSMYLGFVQTTLTQSLQKLHQVLPLLPYQLIAEEMACPVQLVAASSSLSEILALPEPKACVGKQRKKRKLHISKQHASLMRKFY